MCGHVGVAGNIFKQEKEAFRELLWHDWVRGPHSTGVGVVARDGGRIGYYKAVGSPDELWAAYQGKGMTGGIVDDNVKVLLGHNRWATVGAKVAKNAHPFKHGHILGAHNGTLTKCHLKNFPKHNEFDVDSECIFESLATDGFEETMNRIHGAWSLVWYDNNAKKLNFIRNKERPMFVVWNDMHDCLYWASERWMLEISLRRNGVKFKDIQETKEDVLYQLDMTNAHGLKDKELVEVTTHKGFEVPVYKSPFQEKKKETQTVMIGGRSGSQNTQHGLIDDGKYHALKLWDSKNCRWKMPEANSNVVSLPSPKKDINGGPDWKTYKSYNKKEVSFHLTEKKVSKSGTPYYLGALVADDAPFAEKIEVRVYALDHPKSQAWQTWDGYFDATVKKAVSLRGEMYLLIDLRTIQAMEWAEDLEDEEETGIDLDFRWFNNVKIDRQQWVERTDCGCANCTQKPSPFTHEFVVWMSPDTFLCADCGTNNRVLDAIRKQVG